ncbi:MAG: hypothetical protein QOH06_6124 [Acidobacteriota bacterium]|nr:hypothetical protein [Acidobacteriota bacterium]
MTRRMLCGWSVAVLFLGSSLAQAQAPAADESRLILLNSHVIDTGRPMPAIPEALRAPGNLQNASETVIVKFPGPITAQQEKALREASLEVYTYLPHYAYLVKMPAGWRQKARALGASWAGLYHPFYKTSRQISDIPAFDFAQDALGIKEQPRIVMLQVFPDADVRETVRQIRDELGVPGVVGWGRGERFSRVRLLLTPSEIAAHREALAQLGEVFWMDVEPRRVLLNDTTVWVGQSGLSGGQTTPIFSQGIFGEGQTVAILDTGIDPDMCFFRDTALGLPPTNPCNGGTVANQSQRKVVAVNFLWSTECSGGISSTEWDSQNHGTHVAGTVAGDNFANPLLHNTADGMAPGAKLVIQDGGYSVDNCGDLPGIGCPVVDLNPIFQQAYSQGARMHTNSWGDNENAAVQSNYSSGSQDVDEFMWNHKDFLIFFAAGNAGPGTGSVGSPSTAKNGVSVGATLRSTSANSMASFSSCGPTLDGRIKPDITVPGSSIVSAANDRNTGTNNCGTISMSGTSMATPGAAGLTALIRQYYTDGWYPTGSENSANGFTPSAALLKATLVNSAVNMTGTTAIPANCQGWGRVLLENALFFTGQARELWVNDDNTGFATGSTATQTWTFTVGSGEAFKATLAWTDFPSTPAASVNLVNDLDLTVTGPTGTIWRGNVFASGQSTTGGTSDRRNTLEQVLLNAPAAGTYTVSVKAFNVPSGPQPFSLVVTGDVAAGGGNPPVTVFSDTFETSLGWTVNPLATDTATTGLWERGDPAATTSSGTKQLGTTVSGLNDLVTGRLAGAAAGDFDIDGGVTTIQSPAIALPSTGVLTLSFSFYMAHGTNSSTADFFRVRIVGSTTSLVFEELGAANNDDAVWASQSINISSFAGQTVRIRIEAADASTASLVEAAVDDVKIVQQP